MHRDWRPAEEAGWRLIEEGDLRRMIMRVGRECSNLEGCVLFGILGEDSP